MQINNKNPNIKYNENNNSASVDSRLNNAKKIKMNEINRLGVDTSTNTLSHIHKTIPFVSNDTNNLFDGLIVNICQKKNQVLTYIKNISYKFDKNILTDFLAGPSCAILFLSLRYHLLHSHYLEQRIKESEIKKYKVKVVLVYVDLEDNVSTLEKINIIGIQHNITVLLAWSLAESARYLETFKAYENKSAELIQEKIDEKDFIPKVNDVLTTIRSINRTDVATLIANFGSVKQIMNATMEELAICPGLGDKKVKELSEIFNAPLK